MSANIDQTENMVSKYSVAGRANDYIGLQMLDNNGGSPPNCILIQNEVKTADLKIPAPPSQSVAQILSSHICCSCLPNSRLLPSVAQCEMRKLSSAASPNFCLLRFRYTNTECRLPSCCTTVPISRSFHLISVAAACLIPG